MSLITTFRYWCVRRLLTKQEKSDLMNGMSAYIDVLEKRAISEKYPAYDDCKQEIVDLSVLAFNILLR